MGEAVDKTTVESCELHAPYVCGYSTKLFSSAEMPSAVCQISQMRNYKKNANQGAFT